MRASILLLLLICSGSALAQPLASAPPSKTLERAIKLYDKKDFFSASIELEKVLMGESGDDEPNRQRAEFFMAKTLYQMGFLVPAQAHLAAIQQQGMAHPYFTAAAKWAVAIMRRVPTRSPRSLLLPYRDGAVLADPTMASIADELALGLGRELAARDVPKQEAIAILSRVPAGSPFAARAQLAIADAKLAMSDVSGFETALAAARAPELATDATRLIARRAHELGAIDRARAPLGELAKENAIARYQLSRVMFDDRLRVGQIATETFDAVMLATACRGSWPADIRPRARETIATTRADVDRLLAIDDNAELYDRVATLRRATPTGALAIALADPEMQEQLVELAELAHELAAVSTSDKAWQTTQIAAEVLQELTVVQAVTQADAGKLARLRFERLRRGLDELATALDGIATALPAGPDVALGRGLIVTTELCGRVAVGQQPAIAGPGPTSPRATGCAGCATGDASVGGAFALALLVLRRRARAR